MSRSSYLPLVYLLALAFPAFAQPHEHDNADEAVDKLEERIEDLEEAVEERDTELDALHDRVGDLLQAVGYTAEEAAAEMKGEPVCDPEVEFCEDVSDTGKPLGPVESVEEKPAEVPDGLE